MNQKNQQPDNQNDDGRLIQATLDGDTDAFGRLVQKYQDRLFHGISHMLGSPSDAEDVVQEAFVLAYTRLGSFQAKSQFYTWLYRIAINTGISHKRKKRPVVSLDADHSPAHGMADEKSESPDHGMHVQEQSAEVHRALNRLSEEHRRIIVLREMDGLCYESISEILKLPVGTVRSRLHRARAQMRELLGLVTTDE